MVPVCKDKVYFTGLTTHNAVKLESDPDAMFAMFGIHRNHWIRGLSRTLTLFSKEMNVPQIEADLFRQYSNSLMCLVTVY